MTENIHPDYAPRIISSYRNVAAWHATGGLSVLFLAITGNLADAPLTLKDVFIVLIWFLGDFSQLFLALSMSVIVPLVFSCIPFSFMAIFPSKRSWITYFTVLKWLSIAIFSFVVLGISAQILSENLLTLEAL